MAGTLTLNNTKRKNATTVTQPIVSKVVSTLGSRYAAPVTFGTASSALAGAQKIADSQANTVYGGKGNDLLAPTQNDPTFKNYGGVSGNSSASEMASSDAARQSNLESNSLYALMKRLNAESEPAAEDPYKGGNYGGGNGGGNGGGSSYYDPSADLAAAYQARQAAAQQNYDMAREQLQKAYDDSVNALRTQGEDAMRQAYINMMMNKRGLGQSLEAAGLRGGATESALAGIYNNYANNRNSIARAVEEGLTNAGNVYGNNLANLGMQYNTNSADAMEDYQKQLINARQSLASALAKTSSNSRGTSTDVIAANLKNFVKSPVSARRYLSSLGITGSAADEYLWNAGIDPANTYEDAQSTGLNQDYVSVLKNFRNDPVSAKAYADSVGGLSDDYYWAAGINPHPTTVDPSLAATLVSDLNSVVAEANRHTRNENLIEQSLANRMRELAAQYGLTEEQARYILAQAGY